MDKSNLKHELSCLSTREGIANLTSTNLQTQYLSSVIQTSLSSAKSSFENNLVKWLAGNSGSKIYKYI